MKIIHHKLHKQSSRNPPVSFAALLTRLMMFIWPPSGCSRRQIRIVRRWRLPLVAFDELLCSWKVVSLMFCSFASQKDEIYGVFLLGSSSLLEKFMSTPGKKRTFSSTKLLFFNEIRLKFTPFDSSWKVLSEISWTQHDTAERSAANSKNSRKFR